MWNIILKIFLAALAVYLGLAAYVYFNQRSLVYFPDNQSFEECSGFSDSKKVRVGETRMYHNKIGSNTLVVYYHGNAGSVCDRSFIKDRLKDRGFDSLFVEYTGYSGSDEFPSKNKILADVERVDSFLGDQNYENLVFMGMSLGSAVASYHAKISKPDKLVLLGSYSRAGKLARHYFWYLPTGLLLREDYNPAAWLKDVDVPVLVVHGKEDSIVPIDLGKDLFEKIPSKKKRFVGVEEAGHNDLLFTERVWKEIGRFLEGE